MKLIVVTLIVAAGLATGCNPSIESASQDFNTLPPRVQKTIRAEAPDAEIASISKTSENGLDAYKVELRREGQNSEMLIAADGRVLRSDLPAKQDGLISNVERALTRTGAVGTKFSALPADVQRSIQTHASGAEIADVNRLEENGRVLYEVSFRDEGKNPTIRVAEDGTLVQNLQR
jgi:uncharacterized membrane protein YkoI